MSCATQEGLSYCQSELSERRVRLVIGLKRYFHGKRLEGLLSTKVRQLQFLQVRDMCFSPMKRSA
jgi:hypothetical protein